MYKTSDASIEDMERTGFDGKFQVVVGRYFRKWGNATLDGNTLMLNI